MIGIVQYRAAIGRWHLFTLCRPLKCRCTSNHTLSTLLFHALKSLSPCKLLLLFSLTYLLLICGDVHPHPGPMPLHINYANIRSLCPSDRTKRLDEIEHLCTHESLDILCLTETWLKTKHTNTDIQIPNYQHFRRDRVTDTIGGGILIYTHDSIPAKRRLDLEHDDLELVMIELFHQHKSFIVGCCYRPHMIADKITAFFTNLQDIINRIATENPAGFFLFGDFNDSCLTWNSNHIDSELGNKLVEFVNANNLFQVIQETTHITPNNQSLIDLIITDAPGYILDCGVNAPIGDPYHCRIHCKIKLHIQKEASYQRVVWRYDSGDYNRLQDDICHAPWNTLDIFDDVDDAVDYFENILKASLNTCIPHKLVTIRPRDKPWFTSNVRKAFSKRDKLHRKWKQNQTAFNYEKFSHARQEANLIKKTAKTNYYSKICNKLANPTTSSKQYWKLMKQLYGNKVHMGIPPLIKHGKLINSTSEKCDIFNKTFSSKSTLPIQKPILPHLQTIYHEHLEHRHFSEDEILDVLKNLDVSKACGPDNINNRISK